MPWTQLAHILGLDKGGAMRNALDDLWDSLGGDRSSGAGRVGFTIAVVSLCAKMAKADGVAVTVEVEAFQNRFAVPPDEMVNVRRLYDLAKQDVAGFESYAEQIARHLADQPALLADVLECLFHIAAADGIMHGAEETFLQAVAGKFAITANAYQRTRALFVRDPTDPYEVLGARRTDSDAALKAHHRQLVLEHHPDRLLARGVPKAFIAISEAKLAAINAAWDSIRKERHL